MAAGGSLTVTALRLDKQFLKGILRDEI